MAQIDVSEVLDDPNFQDSFQVQRTTVNVDTAGIPQPQVLTFSLSGVIQAPSARQLANLPEGVRSSGAITVWAKFQFIDAGPNLGSDVILFNGYRYRVVSVADWGNWGSGYWQVTAERLDLV